ncbi:hypothetical protein KIW84_024911 [Lathyrus oleraceus]|uniref:Transposase n=1 Tax=Pisum sativum TaxID=3888 RepID=A0A9D5B8A7_PEA|nr:hypothetical protein KIW84_024911 [Pisum sativum]
MPLDIDLNLYLSYEEEEITNVELNVNPSYVDLNVYPSYEEESNVNLNVNHSYEVAEEEYRDDLMNVGLSYEDVFHENEVGTHSSTSHIINHIDISLNETTVSTDVIYRIWRQINETGDACHKKTKNYGRKRVEIDFEKIRDISLPKRSTFRSLAKALGIRSKLILEKYVSEEVLRKNSSALKPHMKDDNMKQRLRFCLSMLEETTISHDPIFKSMYNIVHIDEKWFYMSKNSTNYYLLANEDDLYRTCRNKNYIQKVMFLVAVARPIFDDEDNVTFTGKIGGFPLVDKVLARRSSVNQSAGTLETKPITFITKDVSRMFLINKILPAIKEKWPREHACETIFIQQDNAPYHVSLDDEEFRVAASEGGFDIRLTCQPPNSPDLNVLGLDFFSIMQSLQQKKVVNSVDELIQVVENAYESFDIKSSKKNFLTLQSCMVEIMKRKGSNDYKISHMKKDVLFTQGRLPIRLKCDR